MPTILRRQRHFALCALTLHKQHFIFNCSRRKKYKHSVIFSAVPHAKLLLVLAPASLFSLRNDPRTHNHNVLWPETYTDKDCMHHHPLGGTDAFIVSIIIGMIFPPSRKVEVNGCQERLPASWFEEATKQSEWMLFGG